MKSSLNFVKIFFKDKTLLLAYAKLDTSLTS